MKILLLKYRNIGDVLLTTALIDNLKGKYPKANIDFSINEETEEMLTLNPNLNKIITYDRRGIKSLPIFKRLWREIQFVHSFKKEGYDIVINLTSGDRGNLIAWFSKAPIRLGYPTKNWILRKAITHEMPKQNLRHTIEVNLDPLRVLNIPIISKNITIFWSKNDEEIVSNQLLNITDFIHIHPVSRWMFKCIDDNIMSQVIDYCEFDLGMKVVITASSNSYEIKKVENILTRCKSNPINLSGKLSLKQVAATNNKAKIFIGVDTAVMHISASNNVPVLAFFGPSGADHWGPWDNNFMESGYIKRNGLQTMGRHRVFAESRGCQPCGQDGCDGSKISDCLMAMDINLIKKNIQEMHNAKLD